VEVSGVAVLASRDGIVAPFPIEKRSPVPWSETVRALGLVWWANSSLSGNRHGFLVQWIGDTSHNLKADDMKVIIAGPRDFFDANELELAIVDAAKNGIVITEVVCGKAKGVDTLGEEWAERNGVPVKSFPANWTKHGKAAGYIRNGEMARYGEALIALSYFVPSPGTADMIRQAAQKKLKIHIRNVKR